MEKLTIVIVWDEQDKLYQVRVEELNNLVLYGKNIISCLTQVQIAYQEAMNLKCVPV